MQIHLFISDYAQGKKRLKDKLHPQFCFNLIIKRKRAGITIELSH